MEYQFLVLLIFGIAVGIYSVVIGGGMFFSVPFFQWMFPQLSFGAIIGNLKVGSFFRSIGSTVSTLKQIDYPLSFKISGIAFVATIIGAYTISGISQKWMLPAVIFAVLLAVLAPRLAKKVSNKSFHFTSFFIGLYAGVFGAGIGVLLIALVRLKYPDDTSIAHVKIQARFVEWILVITAVIVHITSGNLLMEIWLPFSIGALIGGFLGGETLKRLGKLSGRIQKTVLYFAFTVAILVAAYKTFFPA
jgi:uncharacterized membrane protein YfcA